VIVEGGFAQLVFHDSSWLWNRLAEGRIIVPRPMER